ncbi:MAG: prephenate dehydratase, partial [bacterium]|nr:prephenate dehydratase [bacterium]
NSSEGIVNHTLDMFIESELYICAERELKIEHYLLSNEKSLKNIKVLYSHPQAISQCSKWIKSNLPNVQIFETSSTADAASHAAIEKNSAAIASLLAKKIYHLNVLAERIQDYTNNYTRFLIISTHYSKKTGSDKTSILVSIKDRVGALYELLKPFKENGINLTKIESRPSKKKPWDYYFFIDFIGHIEDIVVNDCLSKLKESCEFVKFLGSYPKK